MGGVTKCGRLGFDQSPTNKIDLGTTSRRVLLSIRSPRHTLRAKLQNHPSRDLTVESMGKKEQATTTRHYCLEEDKSGATTKIYPPYTGQSTARVIILSGGPHSVHSKNAPSFPDGFVEYVEKNGVFVLGICYGLQLVVQKLGGEVKVGERQYVWMSHGDEVVNLPTGFSVVARSQQGSVAAIENSTRKFYGLQYHPEVTHSPEGMETLQHFLFNVCGITVDWKMEEEIKVINELVAPEDHVICALSRGVDSAIATTLVHKAIRDRLHYIFVDNGLLRFKERECVMGTFERDLHLPVTCVDATEQFLIKLKGIVDPEAKRKIIGNSPSSFRAHRVSIY
ncbi:hypothetical protein IFM89_011228 [Coptis chinensis]|uniref:GMPS ATP-PPase domain-containing protein n=1 Tax=Coptis chinensis TaxID=261450 RepID=A0A835HJV8_9MAGN|nr:hypothetical protein IFM89_011228 [Coptis chinensis]